MIAMMKRFGRTTIPTIQRSLRGIGLGIFSIGIYLHAHAAEPIPIEYMWQVDPTLDFSWWYDEPLLMPHITGKQLVSPRAEVRFLAAQSVVHFRHHPSLQKPLLLRSIIERLEKGEPQSAVRSELVAAACELDNGEQSEALWQLAKQDSLTLPTVESALCRWKKPQALEIWRTRLRERNGTHQELTQACAGLGAVGTQEDLSQLISLVTDGTQSASIRMTTAQAIGELSRSDQLPLAKTIRASTALHADLLAMKILGKQLSKPTSDETLQFIIDVAENGSLVAQREAYSWICEFVPETARAKAHEFYKRNDAEIRRMSLVQINETENEHVMPTLVAGLSDAHPKNREAAREHLLVRATRSEMNEILVKALIGPELAREDWRSQEQCIRLCVELQQPQHAMRLVDLLDHQRNEVCITAAWALRHLGTDEQVLAKMHKHAQEWTIRSRDKSKPTVEERDWRRLSHILEAFGHRRYRPAQETLLKYVPRASSVASLIARVAGTWASGKMWEGEKNAVLTKELCARIADKNNLSPESESIRYAATLALGFISDPDTRDKLIANDEPIGSIHHATKWALDRMDSR